MVCQIYDRILIGLSLIMQFQLVLIRQCIRQPDDFIAGQSDIPVLHAHRKDHAVLRRLRIPYLFRHTKFPIAVQIIGAVIHRHLDLLSFQQKRSVSDPVTVWSDRRAKIIHIHRIRLNRIISHRDICFSFVFVRQKKIHDICTISHDFHTHAVLI